MSYYSSPFFTLGRQLVPLSYVRYVEYCNRLSSRLRAIKWRRIDPPQHHMSYHEYLLAIGVLEFTAVLLAGQVLALDRLDVEGGR